MKTKRIVLLDSIKIKNDKFEKLVVSEKTKHKCDIIKNQMIEKLQEKNKEIQKKIEGIDKIAGKLIKEDRIQNIANLYEKKYKENEELKNAGFLDRIIMKLRRWRV